MDFLNVLIDNYNLPLLSAFLLWIITSISPCTLATNITAISYISKQYHSIKKTLLHWFFFTLWKVFTYSAIILVISLWFSIFKISSIFQWYWDKILWPVLIFIALIMLNIIKLPSFWKWEKIEKIKEKLKSKWYLWTFSLWVLFSLAFCPYSGMMFFWVLIPMILVSTFPLWLWIVYWIWTALPVILFTILLAISLKTMSKAFNAVWKFEKYFRYFIAILFLGIWIYYSYNTFKWLVLIF